MKNNIKISSSNKLNNILNQNKFFNLLFTTNLAHLIIENNNIININILYKNSYIYYMITLNNNSIYYGKINKTEISFKII